MKVVALSQIYIYIINSLLINCYKTKLRLRRQWRLLLPLLVLIINLNEAFNCDNLLLRFKQYGRATTTTTTKAL